ncbi:PQQ-binding-like beta-propeller repeat protein [Ekhidna sp.]|uniref:outer membrane protein assembly factor BamB family protein n=1 Tax=Ekhidna sp. TaxID=2608089 RepID=UPI003C7D999E
MKLLMTQIFGLILITSSLAQSLNLDWSFQTSDRIIASPLIQGETVFVGNERGDFYAVSLTGVEQWKIETGGNIQAKATWVDGNVFFESANVFYLVNAKSGKEVWRFDTAMKPFVFKYDGKEFPFKIDPYDDKRSTAFVHQETIYIGCGNGKVYGLDAKSGEVEVEYQTEDNSPIRSSPLVEDGKLYFGGWNGVVYCYSLADKELMWKKKTYRGEKPYGTFGGIVSEFLIHKGLLYFGARNHMLNVLEASTGEKDWTYTDKNGGWIIGDPVIYNDTLYMGGSDNFTMYAFGTRWGNPIWAHNNGNKNIYTKPIVTNDWVIYSCGSGYNPAASGVLYLIDRMTGKEVDKYDTPMTTLSSPELAGNQVVFGCYDGKIYTIKLE